MKAVMKKAACLSAVLLVTGIIFPGVSTKSSAAETEVLAKVIIPEEEVFASVRSAANGFVDGDGVRLRKGPSRSSTILELMYNEELVQIHYYASTKNWHYVTRIKTKTEGYASKDYIFPF